MSSSATWTLKGISGEFQGNTLALKPPMMTVGRTHQNHIVISDTNISRHHATFFVEGGNVFVQDEKSRNGVMINEKRIDPSTRVMLKHNDRVHIGPHGFVIELDEKSFSTGIQQAPTREMKSEPRPSEKTQFQPTTLLKPALLDKLKKIPWPKQMPKIQMTRRTMMYGIMGVFLLMMLVSQLPKSNRSKGKKNATSTSVEVFSNSTSAPLNANLDDAEIDSLKSRAKAALQFQDYLAASELYEKIVIARPKDEYIKTQHEFSKKQLKRQIERHLEFAKREYEKLNYERAIIEWKQVMALTFKANPEIHEQTEQKIRDTEREMQKRR